MRGGERETEEDRETEGKRETETEGERGGERGMILENKLRYNFTCTSILPIISKLYQR